MKTIKSLDKGFTLIELLVVIAIIGILASIILVSLNSARTKGTNTRVLAETVQFRTQLEQAFADGVYVDLEGSAGNTDTLVSGSAGYDNLVTLLCDIGNQNAYAGTVSGDMEVTCNGVPNLRSGVVIYSTDAGTTVSNYGVYATTTPGGYVCVDSFGNVVTAATSSIPDYASITSPSTALCQ